MSSLLFPSLPGQVFVTTRAPQWNSGYVSGLSGKSGRLAYQRYPLYRWDVSWDVLREATALSELTLLAGFFNAVRGQWDSWLYNDPTFNNVIAEPFGTGDGATAAFPVIATYRASLASAGVAEIIQNFNGAPSIYDNGALVSGANYTIGPTGFITFTTAPVVGHLLTWTGAFYYRCIFSGDDAVFTNFMSKLWGQKSLKFESILLGTQ